MKKRKEESNENYIKSIKEELKDILPSLTLKEKLNTILPLILPAESRDAIRGNELAGVVLSIIPEENGPSIRSYFSEMHKDSSTVLAKIPGKHGYYKRPQPIFETTDSTDQGKESSSQDEVAKRNEQREEKFRSIFMRYNELNSGVFSMHIEHSKGKKEEKGLNKWKYPDVVLLNWDVGEIVESVYKINDTMLEVRKSLGEQPFRLTSNELKTDLGFSNFRENFFQCVSNSKWSHIAQLSIAIDITDSKLIEELSRLGKSYDVTITTFGLTWDYLDRFPDAKKILEMSQEEFDEIANLIEVTYINVGKESEYLDWEHIKDLRKQNNDFSSLFEWIAMCLTEKKALPYNVFHNVDETMRPFE